MSIRAHPDESASLAPASNRRGSSRRPSGLILSLGAAMLGLVGLYVGWHPGLQQNGRCVEALRDLLPEGAAVVIFAMTYLVVAIGRLPGLRLDRAGAALVGASLMVASGVLPLDQVPNVIDFKTIILLLGVMIVVANLRLSGFFRLVNGWVVNARPPPNRAADGRDPGLGSAVGIPGKRHDLPGDDSARPRSRD